MKILGIETSCDETAASVVENGKKVLSNVIASQIEIHAGTQGVVPEVAAREHADKIKYVVEEALRASNVEWDEIDAIAVTTGPGLLSSLVIGYAFAQTLAFVKGKPLIPVHHIAGHLYSNFLDRDSDEAIEFPIITLTASGGHTEIFLIKGHLEFEKIGETLDDSAGEAFDKIAKLLGLGYPGGPAIEKKALSGNFEAVKFPRALNMKENFDFSFSGLKTAVLYEVKGRHEKHGKLDDAYIADIAASFQHTVCDTLTEKLINACKKFDVKNVQVSGGVSANKYLRKLFEEKLKKKKMLDVKVNFSSKMAYCTDNAAMIAGVGYFYYQLNPEFYQGWQNNWDKVLFPSPNLEIEETIKNE